jgi:hypothetical protein
MLVNLSYYSSLLITLLIAVGLFFFIRASVKDRTQQATFASEVAPEILTARLHRYFDQRAYRLIESSPVLVYQGLVQPSLFLAIFLSILAFFGLGSLAIVLMTLVPGSFWLLLLLLSPLAGLFYWRRARRPEIVRLQIIPGSPATILYLKAHRDEIARFQTELGFE